MSILLVWNSSYCRLITGAIPSFVDAILNIAESDTSSSLAHQDNWVYQLHKNGTNNINFFGDDTWIKLFPGLFTRTDGTTSFFVSVSHLLRYFLRTALHFFDMCLSIGYRAG
jgi:predicted AlkP superfamily pyrophosphatase or phosphodiesterase